MAPKKPKTDYQKRKERKAEKLKIETNTQKLGESRALEARHEDAMATHARIAAYAHGKRPELMSMPEELAGTHLGGQFMTPRSLPSPSDEPMPSLANMMRYSKEGVNIGDPMAMIRRTHGAPPPVESSSGGFMGHYRADRKTEASEMDVANTIHNRARELVTDSAFDNFARENNLTTDHTSGDVIGAMINTRKRKFTGGGVDWYEGERVGTTSTGHPQYAEGSSPSMLKRLATSRNLAFSALRRSSAMVSPQAAWSVEKDGETIYPNAEAAAQGMVLGRDTTRTPEDIGSQVGSAVGHGTLPSNIAKSVKQVRGELSPPHETIKPPASNAEGVATAKQSNFDLGLSSPYSETGTYSPSLAVEKSQAYTSDTHDLGVAGIKTGTRIKKDKKGNVVLNKKTGKPTKENPAEGWLSSGGGQDLSIASAQIASAELFNDHYNHVRNTHGHDKAEAWAEANARHYTPNNAQASWWVGERD